MAAGTARSSARSRLSTRTAASSPGFHASWYAIARADEVAPGQVVGRDFLEGRAIVYRGESGRGSVMSAYCRHPGADLGVGKVIGDDVRVRVPSLAIRS